MPSKKKDKHQKHSIKAEEVEEDSQPRVLEIEANCSRMMSSTRVKKAFTSDNKARKERSENVLATSARVNQNSM